MRIDSLDTQEIKSMLLLDITTILVHFLFTQVKQQDLVKSTLLMINFWPCETHVHTYIQASTEIWGLMGGINKAN